MLVRRLAGALCDVAPRPFPETGRDLLQSANWVRLIVSQQVIYKQLKKSSKGSVYRVHRQYLA